MSYWLGLRPLLFTVLVVMTRLVLRPSFLYDMDSVNFALALHEYDPGVHQPHPPGYFLYVMAGRALYALTGDELGAFFWLSVLASVAAVLLTGRLAQEWAGESAGLWTMFWFVFSPLVWFHGTEPLTYIVEMAFSAAVGLMAWRCSQGEARAAFWMGLLLGVAVGFRQSSILFLGPVVVFAVWPRGWKERLWCGGAALGAVLAWWLPMIAASGGWERYAAVFGALWRAGGGSAPFWSQPQMVLPRTIGTMLALFSVSGMAVWPYLVVPRLKTGLPVRFAWVWVMPGLAFLCLMFFKTVNSGYVLALAPPWLAALGAAWAVWKMPERKRLMRAGLIAMLNVVFLAAAPFYFSRRSEEAVERELKDVCACVEAKLDPSSTVLVGIDTHFLGFRHAGWYLPQFRVMQYPGQVDQGGAFAPMMQGRRSRKIHAMPEGVARYALFPLPAAEEYRESWEGFVKLLPQGGREEASCGSVRIITGPAAHLRALYPRLPQALQGPAGPEK